MTDTLIVRLRNLAATAGGSIKQEAVALVPKLHAAADEVEHKLEAWTSAVDTWVETHFTPEAEKARELAGAAYRSAVTEAHVLIAEVSTHL